MTVRRWLLAPLTVVVLTLGGCGNLGPPSNNPASPDPRGGGWFSTSTVRLPDGRNVICVTWADGYRGGISCDFAGAKP